MIEINKLITPERVVRLDQVSSKKRVLEYLSEMIVKGESNLSQSEVFESLCGRERLGSTGLGHGVAIPHGRQKNLEYPIGAFIQLKNGVDYDAIDSQPVDLICALIVPEQSTDEHLNILAFLAEMFSDNKAREKLRSAHTSDDIYSILTSPQPENIERMAGHSA